MNNIKKFICVLMLIAADITALLVAFLVAYVIRSEALPHLATLGQPALPLSTQLTSAFSLIALILIIIFAFEKLYTKRFSFWDETRHLLKGITLSFVLLMVIVFITRSYTQFSRAVLVITCLLSLVTIPFFRLFIKKLLVKIDLWKKNVLILGTDAAAKLIVQGLEKNPTLGYKVVGLLTDNKALIGNDIGNQNGVRVIGEISELEKLSKVLDVQDIIIAIPSIGRQRLTNLVERCEKLTETIRIIPDTGSLFTVGVETENLGDILSLSVARNLAKPWNIFVKRVFEFFSALLFFACFSPFFLVISLAIKLNSPGPVFFFQERLGQKGKTFKIIKFRSMYAESDAKLREYLSQNLEVQKEWEQYQKIKNNDPRVTKVGKFLRKYSLDESPQLLNVLKGEMSLVGPRPYLPRERLKMGEALNIISRVKPALTGLWQVSGRNILPFKERLIMDEYYIRNWSFWLDIVILLRTLRVIVKREGAY